MNQFVKVTVAVLVIMAMLFGAFGCATEPATSTAAPATPTSPTPVPPTAPSPAPTSAAQPAAEVIELKYHHHDPPMAYSHKNGHEVFARMIEEKTNGKVKVTVYPGETLGKAGSAIDMVTNGIADIAWGYIGMFSGRFPFMDMNALPMLGVQDGLHGSKVVWETYKSTPEQQQEFSDVHMLFVHTAAPLITGFTNKRVRSLEDLQGLRLRAITGPPLKFMQAQGATPVTVPMPEIFEALEKGTIDGYVCDWSGIGSFRFAEVSKYILEEPLYVNTFFLIMNKKRWDSLPPDVQQAISEISGDAGSAMYAKVWEEGAQRAREATMKMGNVEVLKLSDAERERWANEVAPVVHDEYIEFANSKGADGQVIVDRIKGLYQQYMP